MGVFRIINRINFSLICGFCLGGCHCDSTESSESNVFPLTGYVDVVVHHIEKQEVASTITDAELLIRVCLINKTAKEIQVFFDGRQCQIAGGFRVHIDTDVYVPSIRLAGTKEYDSLLADYGLLPSYGRKEFELLLRLPEAHAQRVLVTPETMQVILEVHGICYDGAYTEIIGPNSDISGRWKLSK